MKPLLILLLTVSFYSAVAQKQGQALIDSLVAELPKLKDDSVKCIAYGIIGETYQSVNPMKGFSYNQKGLELAEKIKWKAGIANFANNIGLRVSDTGNTQLARVYLNKSYAVNLETGNKYQQINNLINIARTYQFDSDFANAISILYKALAGATENKSNGQVALIANNLASSYFTQQNYPKATEFAQMGIKYGTTSGNTYYVSKAYQQLAGIKHMLKDTVAAIADLQKAISICQANNDIIGMADAMLNLGLEYADYKKQIEIMLRVDSIMKEMNPNSEISLANKGNLGNAYNQLSKQTNSPGKEIYIQKAQTYLLEAKELSEQNQSPEYQAHMYSMLSDLEENKTNYKNALEYLKKANTTNDSLFSQEKKNELAGLEGRYNIELKNKEIAINKMMLSGQRKTLWGLIIGLALVMIIGGLLYWQGRSRKKVNTALMVLNNELDEANKLKARFFGILSHDLRAPIVNLVHFLHLQKDAPDLLNEAQQDAYKQKIGKSAQDLLSNMESMLLWSKEQMGNFRPDIKNVAVADLFTYLQQFFDNTPNVTITYEHAPGLMVATDENYLMTIMQNLTSNAIKALAKTPDAKIEWKAKKDGDKTILLISDNGPGLGAEESKTLFDDRIADNGKHGLGFHLVRDLAKAINYKISVKSEFAKGTTFILSSVAA